MSETESREGYVLGTDDHELRRLSFQQEVWGAVTDRFLDRLDVRPGARVLDLGCGPGLVLERLRERVGPSGSVVGLDASERWISHLVGRRREERWSNVELVHGTIADLDVEGPFDVVFTRWVLSFVPEPGAVVRSLAGLLGPGGVLGIEDYNHEGVSLFPESEGFRALIRATRALYRRGGGDTWIAGHLPRHALDAGLRPEEPVANVLCGGPGSPAFRWADAFFPYHSAHMVEAGVLTEDDRARFLTEWAERKADPATCFFSPIVVDFLARKPG